MLTEAASAEEAVRSRTTEPRGTVRVASSVATAQAGLALVLAGFIRLFPKVRASPTPVFCADDPASLRIAACDALGIAMLPVGLCRGDLEVGRLARVLPQWTAGGAFISILTPHRRGQLPAVRAVSDHIADHLRAAMVLET